MTQRLILEDSDTTYDVVIDSTSSTGSDYITKGGPSRGLIQPTVSPELHVKLSDVHRTIQGYTQYAIGAFRNLAIVEVEEINLRFKIKISAESGIPMLASGKTEADFEIEVKCKFPEKN
jgi:Trypsin-co-occurring domain 1